VTEFDEIPRGRNEERSLSPFDGMEIRPDWGDSTGEENSDGKRHEGASRN
jgi:hypothetical protein